MPLTLLAFLDELTGRECCQVQSSKHQILLCPVFKALDAADCQGRIGDRLPFSRERVMWGERSRRFRRYYDCFDKEKKRVS